MRILGPIVLSQTLLMLAGEPKMLEGGVVGTQLVRCHFFRREALLAEQLAHELDACALIPLALNQDLEGLSRCQRHAEVDRRFTSTQLYWRAQCRVRCGSRLGTD